MKEDLFHVEEELFVSDKIDCITKILDEKYEPANLKELTANLPQLTANQREQLYDFLKKRFALFGGKENRINRTTGWRTTTSRQTLQSTTSVQANLQTRS